MNSNIGNMRRIIIALLLAGAICLTACNGDTDSSQQDSNSTADSVTTSATGGATSTQTSSGAGGDTHTTTSKHDVVTLPFVPV